MTLRSSTFGYLLHLHAQAFCASILRKHFAWGYVFITGTCMHGRVEQPKRVAAQKAPDAVHGVHLDGASSRIGLRLRQGVHGARRITDGRIKAVTCCT